MARVNLNASQLNAFANSVEIQGVLQRVAEQVLEDSDSNIISMDAIDSGDMLQSGKVTEVTKGDRKGKRIGYDVPYAAIVHEGSGLGRNGRPRPYLGNAAFRDRGRLK